MPQISSFGTKFGSFLNRYCENDSPFVNAQKYNVCCNLLRQLSYKETYKKVSPKTEFVPTIPLTRAERYTKRQELYEEMLKECSTEEVEKIRKKPKMFEDRVIESAKRFQKPFSTISFRGKLQRIDMIASLIIGSCIDRSEQTEFGSSYLKNNENLGNEIMNMLNLVKDRIENMLEIDFNLLQYPDPVQLVDEDADIMDVTKSSDLLKCKDKTIWDLLEDDTIKFAYGIIGESTGRGFERIRKKYNNIQPNNPLPSSYNLQQKLPVSIVPFQHELMETSKCLVPTHVKNEIMLGFLPNHRNIIKSEDDAVQMFCNVSTIVEEDGNQQTSDVCTKIIGANIDASYVDVMNMMIKKHVTKGRSIVNGIDDVIIINSFDGAEAFKSRKNVSGIISFSS